MRATGKKAGAPTTSSFSFKQEKIPPTAVIVAEDLAYRFEPLSSYVPHSLLPLGNVPLLHISLSRVIYDGFQNIIIYACRDWDKIRDFVESNAYTKRQPRVSIQVVGGHGARGIGDVMRDLEGHQALRGVEEFVCIPADLVCDVNARELLVGFQQYRAENPTAALGVVYSAQLSHVSCDTDRLSAVYSDPDMKLLQLNRQFRETPVLLSTETLEKEARRKKTVRVASKLVDPHILLCSSHVAPLFQDNFDYDSMDDLVHGMLTNEEIMGFSIHVQFTPVSKFVQAVAPSLSHFLEITPRLLNRLGSSMIRPASFIGISPFTRITEKLQVTSSPMAAISPSCYIARSANVHADARLIGACCIGEDCHIQSNVVLVNTVLGDGCTVLPGARLRGVIAMSTVHFGRDVVVDGAWICPGAWIDDRVRLGPRCFIGAPKVVSDPECLDLPSKRGAGLGVTVGPDISIPPESILVEPGPTSVVMSAEECGSRGWAAIYQPEAPDAKISFSTDENDTSDFDGDSSECPEVVLWRTDWCVRGSTRSRNASRLISTTGGDDSETSRSRLRSGDFDSGAGGHNTDSEHDGDEDGEVSDEFLITELQKTLARSAQLNQPTDVVLLEVNSLKHAFNISLEDLAFFLIKALLQLATASSSPDKKAFAVAFKTQLALFKGVLHKYFESSENCAAFCLQAVEDQACYQPLVMDASQWLIHGLYDADLVSEESIKTWVKSSPLLTDEDLADGCAKLRTNISPFLKWLDEADEEDSDDE